MTFTVNASFPEVAKAYIFYLKNKKKIKTLRPVKRANPSGTLNNFTRYGINIFERLQKKDNLLSLPLSVGS